MYMCAMQQSNRAFAKGKRLNCFSQPGRKAGSGAGAFELGQQRFYHLRIIAEAEMRAAQRYGAVALARAAGGAARGDDASLALHNATVSTGGLTRNSAATGGASTEWPVMNW